MRCVGGTAGCHAFQPRVVQCVNRGFDGYDVQVCVWPCAVHVCGHVPCMCVAMCRACVWPCAYMCVAMCHACVWPCAMHVCGHVRACVFYEIHALSHKPQLPWLLSLSCSVGV